MKPVDRSEILIGDVVRYSVIVTRDSNIVVTLPPLAANLGQFEIRDYQVLDPVQTEGRWIEQTDYLVSTFDTGEFQIPSLQIFYRIGSDSTEYRLKTEPLTIQVKSLNPDEAGDIREIKPLLLPPLLKVGITPGKIATRSFAVTPSAFRRLFPGLLAFRPKTRTLPVADATIGDKKPATELTMLGH